MALVGDDVPTHDGVDRVSTDEPCSRPPIQGNDSSTFPTTCTWSGRADRAGGDGAAEGGLAPPASAAALRRLRGALSADREGADLYLGARSTLTMATMLIFHDRQQQGASTWDEVFLQ